ncbi:rho-related BTB domain-containing protein 1 [Trichonephila inaurata madagascariensis]|uniref:Rho-related BTB domain-containing protein 1 n=1 Tax=Trichonephila inaurata madagascariensis TaxID=2747483 RepID=A0A8X7BPI1_9ARAC|nr:rho-related BTB domain-containing protein 1 [Trichonephila inaurata madagascariensis]
MDNEQPHQEHVKCVVVGDTAVGKTRLICARACNARLTLNQLLTTHIPTVWAIDQYRIYKEVLERSCEVVDGVNVSLRLWDTFGDHDKDRRFAYGRSDVVLLCFSIANPMSLRNCKVIWYPEIRRFCPSTPIVLVGCKNDLRYMYRDEQFQVSAETEVHSSGEIIHVSQADFQSLEEQGRSVAKEIGAPYYETSVLTHFGVNEVFENVIRAALLSRRQQRFWMTNLKHVQRPLLQVPFCPPEPRPPQVIVPPPQFEDDMLSLLHSQMYTDVIFLTGKVGFAAHKSVLSAVCNSLYKLFTIDITAEGTLGGRSASDSSVVSSSDSSIGNFNTDTEQLLTESPHSVITCASFCLSRSHHNANQNNVSETRHGSVRRRSSCQIHPESHTHGTNIQTGIRRILDHRAYQCISIERCEGLDHRGRVTSSIQTIVTLANVITPSAMQNCLRFLYTGGLDQKMCINMTELLEAAELMDIPELQTFDRELCSPVQLIIGTGQHAQKDFSADLHQKFAQKVRNRMREVCLHQGLFSDVYFQLEDGLCCAHKPILMARCDVMAAMFRGDFRESSAKVVHFPGVTKCCFQQLLVYLYTDEIDDSVIPSNCLELLELANRLCLPRLVGLVEQKVIHDLIKFSNAGKDTTEHALRLLEPCQMHNADQLADWCLYHIAVNYNDICRKTPKLLRNLHPENQAYLNRNRWPPVWYLKEYDYYERCVRERQWQEKPPKVFKRHRNNSTSGCLCFTGRNRNNDSKRAYRTV